MEEANADQNYTYYQRRAEEERRLATCSSRAHIAEIHAELAKQYEALADQGTLRRPLELVLEDQKPSLPQV